MIIYLILMVVLFAAWYFVIYSAHRDSSWWSIAKAFFFAFLTFITLPVWASAFGFSEQGYSGKFDSSYFIFACLCTAALIIAFLHHFVPWRKRRKAMASADKERKIRVAEINATGFDPTIKYLGSGRMFAVDEKQGTWYVMNYYRNPGSTKIHKISDIRGAFKAANKEYVQSGGGTVLGNGLMLNNAQINSYYSKLGVVVNLNDSETPTEFIDCYENESDADNILSQIEILTKGGIEERVKSSDSVSDIRELKSLLDDGIITRGEFDAKKKQLLGL